MLPCRKIGQGHHSVMIYIHTLLYLSHQCFMPSFVELGPLVRKKIFEGDLPLGMVAISVK